MPGGAGVLVGPRSRLILEVSSLEEIQQVSAKAEVGMTGTDRGVHIS